MKRFEFLVLLAIVQIGVLSISTVQVQDGVFLNSGFSNSVLGNSMQGVANSLENINANLASSSNKTAIPSQDFIINVPFMSNITFIPPHVDFGNAQVTTLHGIPNGSNWFGLIMSIGSGFLSVLWLLMVLCANITLGSVFFYQMIILALLPNSNSLSTQTQALAISTIFALIQTALVVYEVIKSIKGIRALSFGVSVDADANEGKGLPFEEAGGLE